METGQLSYRDFEMFLLLFNTVLGRLCPSQGHGEAGKTAPAPCCRAARGGSEGASSHARRLRARDGCEPTDRPSAACLPRPAPSQPWKGAGAGWKRQLQGPEARSLQPLCQTCQEREAAALASRQPGHLELPEQVVSVFALLTFRQINDCRERMTCT